jgi:hypothetical protein
VLFLGWEPAIAFAKDSTLDLPPGASGLAGTR